MKIARLLLLFVATSLLGQVKESVTVSVVEVPVTVVDREGNAVRGLTADNFELFDDGKLRPITSVDQIDFKSKASVAAVSPMNPAAKRNFLLLFDLSYGSPESMGRAQKSAREFVATMTDRRDKVAVGTIDTQRGFRLLTAFTTDRKAIAEALAAPMSYRSSDPLQIAGHALVSEEDVATMDNLGPPGTENNLRDFQRLTDQANDQMNRSRIERQIDLLGGLAKTLNSIAGRKHVVLLSEGFDPRLVQGRDASVTTEETRDITAIQTGNAWQVDTDSRYGNAGAITVLQRMGELFHRSDVVLDALDIKGLRTNLDAREGVQKKSNEGLYVLANATGGEVFKNAGDVSEDFRRLMKQQEVTYVLAFRAPTTRPGTYHNLKVRLVNVPGGRVSHRAGYYEAGAQTATERSLSNAEVVLNDIPQDAIHLALLASAFPTSSSNAQVPVIVEARGADILNATKGKMANADIFVYAFDDEGTVRDALFQRVGLDVAKGGSTLTATGIRYYGTLSLPPGHYAIKTLVRVPEADVKGFARTDLVVPRSTEVAMSAPVFFAEGAQWVMVKGSSHDTTNAAYPFQINGESFIPSAAAHPGRQFVVFVQNAPPEDLELATSPGGAIVRQLKTANGSKVVVQLDPVSATPASLDVEMRVKSSGERRTASVPLVR